MNFLSISGRGITMVVQPIEKVGSDFNRLTQRFTSNEAPGHDDLKQLLEIVQSFNESVSENLQDKTIAPRRSEPKIDDYLTACQFFTNYINRMPTKAAQEKASAAFASLAADLKRELGSLSSGLERLKKRYSEVSGVNNDTPGKSN